MHKVTTFSATVGDKIFISGADPTNAEEPAIGDTSYGVPWVGRIIMKIQEVDRRVRSLR